MTRRRSPTRLVIALSVAALLTIFLLYTSVAGGTPSLQPSELDGRTGVVGLTGRVVGEPAGDARGAGLRFRLRDLDGKGSGVLVRYKGSVPDLFRPGRDVHLEGRLQNGVFVAKPDTLVTKCPSKYSPSRSREKG